MLKRDGRVCLRETSSILWSILCLVLSLPFLASAPLVSAQETELSELRAEERAALEAALAASREARLAQAKAAETQTFIDVVGSVSASARCAVGYVVDGNFRTSAPDVEIVSTQLTDCSSEGVCSAYQVNAKRESDQPFSLEVSVSCSS